MTVCAMPTATLMDASKYQCPNCQHGRWQISSTHWICEDCGQRYSCVEGIPRLYLESSIGPQDQRLRDRFYNSLLGRYYQYLMPFLSLPVRPARASWKGWVAYALIIVFLVTVAGMLARIVYSPDGSRVSVPNVAVVLLSVLLAYGSFRHPYLFYLMLLAIPVRISILLRGFTPAESFTDIHARVIDDFLKKDGKLQVLDISTGTCNSLYRHGWMKLNADYTGLDLSEVMLRQGRVFMAQKRIPMEFVLADATRLPFRAGTFDIVLNYGAVNGISDPQRALDEMARVARRGGLVLFLDEQLYQPASFIERLYFRTVLSRHNVIHRCPIELMPRSLELVTVHQVYQFYYLCTSYKA